MQSVKGYHNPEYINYLRIIFSQYHSAPINAEVVTATVYTFLYGLFDMEPAVEAYMDFYYSDAAMFCRELDSVNDWLMGISEDWSTIEEIRITELHLNVVGIRAV